MRPINLLPIILLLSLTGCTAAKIDGAIRSNELVADKIELGDSKEKVLKLLRPIEIQLGKKWSKQSEQMMADGKKIYIFYARTFRQADNLKTDDEFTPYIFEDGKLVAIGWQSLGGAKSHGQVVPQTNVYIHQKQTVR